jgi:glycosyltransferase involved in cell wall biosynthesis
VRGRLGWSAEETVVLHAGSIGARQDLDNVVAAARLADEHHAPVRFVLLGDGTQRERLRMAAAAIRSLQFLDPLPETEFLQTLASADVLLAHESAGRQAPSVPGVLTTYLATGVPVLAVTEANSVTASEIRAAGAGVRVEPGSPRHLLQAALALRADPARCRALGGSGRRYCDGQLGQPAAVDHFERWLHEIAGVPVASAYADAT